MEQQFYQELYSSKQQQNEEEIQSYLDKIETPTLNIEEQGMCDGELTIEECLSALKSFANNKSPGNDGLTVEFYRKFWPIIGKHLVQSLNESYISGELSPSQRHAIITLLDKGKDRCHLKNWRPISLLNIDYKIATKALAIRLKDILPKLIHSDQVGYVKDRNIAENVRTIQDILTYTNNNNIPGFLISIDFQKAFDSVEWKFLELVLRKFNFGSSFINWVKTLYRNISSSVINNGVTTKQFLLERGVRQGDPLSPYLFILAGEILSNVIRQNANIKGLNIDDKYIKMLQYADDTTGILKDEKSAKLFLQEVETFGAYSGLRLNKDKTEGFKLGPNRNNNSKPFGITWPTRPIRLLGIFFSYDTEDCNKYNFEDKIKQVKSVINLWKMRDLTKMGKIQIIKTYIVSKFVYTCSVIHMPQKYANEINSLIFGFIWNNKRDKLKRSVMIRNLEEGGLRAPDINLMIDAAKINWIKRYLSPPTTAKTWKVMVQAFFQNRWCRSGRPLTK